MPAEVGAMAGRVDSERERRLFARCTWEPLTPKLSIEHAVIDGFADVFGVDFVRAIEIGDGAGHAQDFIVSAGGEAHFLDALPEEVGAGVVELAVLANLARCHLGVLARPGT